MKFLIFGAGGVGAYFGGRLAQAGQDVTFLARGAHLRAIQESGLRVESTLGNFRLRPVCATDSPSATSQPDVILLAVKAWQLPEAIAQIQPLLGGQTLILPLLNGMAHMDALLNAFGAGHVLGGLCRVSAFIAEPGFVRHVAIDPYLAFAEWDNRPSQRVADLLRIFQSVSGFTAESPADIQRAMWEKYQFICAFSGVGAVTRQPIGIIRSTPESRALFCRALEEVAAVSAAHGVTLDVEAMMRRVDSLPPETMASMQKDIMAGRPSELEAQTGALARMARAAGIPVPAHEFIYASLLLMEKSARNLI